MKRELLAVLRQYEAALQKHLQPGWRSRMQPARRLGQQAVKLGLETLDLTRIHKTALAALMQPGGSSATRKQMVHRAGIFFTEVITPIEETHRAGVALALDLNQKNKTLTRRTAQLAAANDHLKRGIVRRKAAEEALRASGRYHGKLLRESRLLHKHLQHLTHRILLAQENERSKLSHDLHDEIAQTLLGINVRLLTLKKGATGGRKALAKEFASTRRLVKSSVRTINRFAREFGAQHEA